MRKNAVRIIGGRWRSRRLKCAAVPGVRPSPDAARETLFNWLASRLPGARCLDLFAGSGALGFEAASRGAAHVVLVESHPRAVAALRANRAALRAESCVDIFAGPARRFLHGDGGGRGDGLPRHPRSPIPRHPRSPIPRHPRSPIPRHPRSLLSGGGDCNGDRDSDSDGDRDGETGGGNFDIVFLDPPFAAPEALAAALDALARGRLNPGALVYIESPGAAAEFTLPADWRIIRASRCGAAHSTLVQT